MEAFRNIVCRVATTTGHPPSRILNAARAMCAASIYGIDCGEPLPHNFPAVAAPEPSALAGAPPPTPTSPLLVRAASRTRTAADGSFALVSPPLSFPRSTRSGALPAGIRPRPLLLLLAAASLAPASSCTASDLSPHWARRPPDDPSRGGFIFGAGKVLRGTSFSRAHRRLPSSVMSRSASYSTSSRDEGKSGGSEDPPITYAIGMFDDIYDPKFAPLEFADAHMLVQKVELPGDEVGKEYTVLSELAKGWFVSLPLLIEKLKKHGYSFYNPVTVSQLMVDRHGQFVLADGTLLRKTSKRYVSKDFFSSASVYEEIVRHRNGEDAVHHLPDSFKDFLMTLRKKRTPHGYFMCVHPFSLPLPAYSQAYLDVYDHVRENLSDVKAKEVLSCLKVTSYIWGTIMEGNVLLVAWFEDPYNQNRSEDRFVTGNPKHLSTYLRHIHSHLLEYQKLLGKRYTKDEARMLVECKFSKVMSNLYWKLWDMKLLPVIESEIYFCKPGGACCPTPGFCLRRELRLKVKSQKTGGAESTLGSADQSDANIVQAKVVESQSSTLESTTTTQRSANSAIEK